jgi:kynurenine formamidase
MTDVLAAALAPDRLVDLTQPLGPATLLWPGSPRLEAVTEARHETGGGYYRSLSLSEHSGTHLDAPVHFAPGGRTAAELDLSVLVRPAVRLDVRARCGGDADYAVSRADVEELEAAAGRIPPGAAVLVCTGWDAYLDDADRYIGSGSVPRFPGVGADAAAFLVERGVVGIGIDTLGVDPGRLEDFPAHRVTQPAGVWHLEGLVRLGDVPDRGAWLVAAVLPLVNGSGSPARAFAILPEPADSG